MFGPISGSSYTPYYAAFSAQNAAHTANNTVPVPQTESIAMPVQPVAPAREAISNEAKFSVESLLNQHNSDPVAMAARMRIQYPGQSTQEPAGETPVFQSQDTKSAQETMNEAECQTCENRKYQDGSDDPGVSFKTATKLSPEEAATAVRGHEMEHVVREQAKATREDRQVVSQSVTIKTAICPECGTVYASGGTTRTVTKASSDAIPQTEPAQNTEPASPAA